MDVKTAYLNAPLDCEIYIEQPEGFEVISPNDTDLVCKLSKSLYDLKQSGCGYCILKWTFGKGNFHGTT